MALSFHGIIMAGLIALEDAGLSAAMKMLNELLPLSTCKVASTRALLCIFIDQVFLRIEDNIRDQITTELDRLLRKLVQLACDNIASVRVAALSALKPWSEKETQVVRLRRKAASPVHSLKLIPCDQPLLSVFPPQNLVFHAPIWSCAGTRNR